MCSAPALVCFTGAPEVVGVFFSKKYRNFADKFYFSEALFSEAEYKKDILD